MKFILFSMWIQTVLGLMFKSWALTLTCICILLKERTSRRHRLSSGASAPLAADWELVWFSFDEKSRLIQSHRYTLPRPQLDANAPGCNTVLSSARFSRGHGGRNATDYTTDSWLVLFCSSFLVESVFVLPFLYPLSRANQTYKK